MKKLLFIFAFLSLTTLPLLSQDVSKQNAQKKKIEQEIAYIDSQIRSTKNKQSESFSVLSLTQKKIESRKKLLEEIDKEIKNYEYGIVIKNQELSRLESRLDTLRSYYDKLVYNSYKNRDSKVWFMFLLASENIGQGFRRWSYLRNLSNGVKAQADAIRETQNELIKGKEELRQMRLSSIDVQKQREKEYTQLSDEEVQVMNTINKLNKQEKQYRTQLNKKKKEIEKLNKEIERILAEAVRQQKKAGSKIVIDYELSAQFSDNKGKLPWPVKKGVVVEKFGQGYHPVFRNIKMPFNNGINISTEKNSEAYCIFNGVVKQILVMPGYNQCVLVQHGEYFTFYTKLKRVYVKSGQKMKTGEAIGTIDDTEEGNAILHFQLWKNTDKQNPEHWLIKR